MNLNVLCTNGCVRIIEFIWGFKTFFSWNLKKSQSNCYRNSFHRLDLMKNLIFTQSQRVLSVCIRKMVNVTIASILCAVCVCVFVFMNIETCWKVVLISVRAPLISIIIISKKKIPISFAIVVVTFIFRWMKNVCYLICGCISCFFLFLWIFCFRFVDNRLEIGQTMWMCE